MKSSSSPQYRHRKLAGLHEYASPWRLEASTTAQLVWAVPVTLDSFMSGVTSHRFWFKRMEAFRESILVPKIRREGKGAGKGEGKMIEGEGPEGEEMMSRLPEELLCMIEALLKDAGRKRGNDEIDAFNRSMARVSLAQKHDMLMDRLFEIEGTMNEWDCSGDPEKRYMMSVFCLALAPGFTMDDDLDCRMPFAHLTHVFLCIPWNFVEVSRRKDDLKLARSITAYSVNKPSVLVHRAPGAEGMEKGKFTSRHKVAIVDPEYVIMTDEKCLRINAAIKCMELEVLENFEFQQSLPKPRGWRWPRSGGYEMAQELEIFRLSSKPKWMPDDEALNEQIENWPYEDSSDDEAKYRPARFNEETYDSDDSEAAICKYKLENEVLPGGKFRRVIDVRPSNWPSKLHEKYGKSWQPQLLLMHQSNLLHYDSRRDHLHRDPLEGLEDCTVLGFELDSPWSDTE